MKQIPLTQGKFALVDDEDFEELSKVKWRANKGGNTFYAIRSVYFDFISKSFLMHREILGLNYSEFHVDHIDGNGLNNQRSNLRICTHRENMMNRATNKNSTSHYKGVSWARDRKKWRAEIEVDAKRIKIGCFETEKYAARAYNEAAIKYHGEFARLNKVE